MSTIKELERALKVYNKTHPKQASPTVAQFSSWFLTHRYYAEGSSKLPCEACGMPEDQHDTRSHHKEKVSP